MDPSPRSTYNAAFAPQSFERYAADLVRRLGCEVGFRLAETPIFLSTDFRERTLRAAREILAQLRDPARIERMAEAVPERWRVPRRSSLPTFAVIDFAVTREPDGTFSPRVVELQGFPSLLAFETMQGDAWSAQLQHVAGLEGAWTSRLAGQDRDALLALARAAIVGDHDPNEVVLLDLEPLAQKTFCDFAATKQLFGVDWAAPQDLACRSRRLFRRDAAGREIPVKRIYNRMIVDEIERTQTVLPFDLRDDIDVEWTPHPDWFFIWSKHSLPYLDHWAVPKTQFLCDVRELPAELESRFVLKPLFSFAGGGVNVRPTPADVAAIPERECRTWCLQERVDYAEAIRAPDGGAAKLEVRTMFLRPEAESAFTPAINLCRMTRGEMVGVAYNRDMPWTGSTIGLWRE